MKSRPVDWDRFFEENGQPLFWHRSAHDLMASADFLWTEVAAGYAEMSTAHARHEHPSASAFERGRHSFSALLLSGYGTENLLKAIRLQQRLRTGPLPIVAGKLDKYFKTHKLPKLATDTGFSKKPEDDALLRLLEKTILWAGKYPVPLTAESGEVFRVSASYDRPRVREFFDRLDGYYAALPK